MRFSLTTLLLLSACAAPTTDGEKSISLGDVDRELGQLTGGVASLASPAALEAGGAGVVRLQVAAEAAQLDSQAGASVGLASRMRASLIAPDLEVHALSPELQAVSATSPTEWTWEIRGTRNGPATLHVTLSAALVLNGVETPRVLRSFDRTVSVTVSYRQRLASFLQEQWQWVLATLGAPLLGGLWRWRRSRQAERVRGTVPPS